MRKSISLLSAVFVFLMLIPNAVYPSTEVTITNSSTKTLHVTLEIRYRTGGWQPLPYNQRNDATAILRRLERYRMTIGSESRDDDIRLIRVRAEGRAGSNVEETCLIEMDFETDTRMFFRINDGCFSE